MTTLVERFDFTAALQRSRSRRDTEAETIQFAQATLAAAKQEGLQLAVRARYVALLVIAGLLPIMFGGGTGSEVMRRIAAPMVGGMITAPVLSMLVLPPAYLLLHRRNLRRMSVVPKT